MAWGTSIFQEISKGRRWSEAIAVGSLAFGEKFKSELASRQCIAKSSRQACRTYALRESSEAYGCKFVQENETLTPENKILWQKFTETAET